MCRRLSRFKKSSLAFLRLELKILKRIIWGYWSISNLIIAALHSLIYVVFKTFYDPSFSFTKMSFSGGEIQSQIEIWLVTATSFNPTFI